MVIHLELERALEFLLEEVFRILYFNLDNKLETFAYENLMTD